MIKVIRIILCVINIISFVLVVLFMIYGFYDQLVGPGYSKKLLELLNIPLSYDQVLIFGFICTAIMIITYIIRTKFFD